MHICLICDELPPGPHGGVGSFTADLANGLADAGNRVTVLVAEVDNRRHWSLDKARKPGINSKVIGVHLSSPAWMRWRPGSLWQKWQLLQALKAEHSRDPFDIVECMDNGGLLPFGAIKAVPCVVRLHGASFFYDSKLRSNTTDSFTHWLEKQTLRQADHLVAVSNYVAKEELAVAGSRRHSDCTIYNAVDTDFFSPDPSSPLEAGLIVFANTIHPRKGIVELCNAMNILGGSFPSARLLILGKEIAVGTSGRALSAELMDEVKAEFRNRVIFAGMKQRPEVLAHLRRAHVCCYPSKLETFGIAPLEAMAVGKPTIFSHTGAGPEVIEDGVSGLLCNPDSPEDIARKISLILSDDNLAVDLGKGARERAVSHFGLPGWIARNLAFYNSVVSDQKPVKLGSNTPGL